MEIPVKTCLTCKWCRHSDEAPLHEWKCLRLMKISLVDGRTEIFDSISRGYCVVERESQCAVCCREEGQFWEPLHAD